MPLDDDVLQSIKPRPIRMSLPAGAPGGFADRRDHARRAALVRRILAEFDDMPGMTLSLKQAGRFLGIDEKACARILTALTREGYLRRNPNLQYGRAEPPRRRASH